LEFVQFPLLSHLLALLVWGLQQVQTQELCPASHVVGEHILLEEVQRVFPAQQVNVPQYQQVVFLPLSLLDQPVAVFALPQTITIPIVSLHQFVLTVILLQITVFMVMVQQPQLFDKPFAERNAPQPLVPLARVPRHSSHPFANA